MKVFMTVNTLLYGGISLIVIGLILFVISQYKLRGIENKIDRQKKTTSIIYERENKMNIFKKIFSFEYSWLCSCKGCKFLRFIKVK